MKKNHLVNFAGAIVLLICCLFSSACEESFCVADNASWPPVGRSRDIGDGTSIVLVSPQNPSELVLGQWPTENWQILGQAHPGYGFHHPLWLQDERGRPLIAAFEIPEASKDSKGAGYTVRVFDVGLPNVPEGLQRITEDQLEGAETLISAEAGLERRSLIYAAGRPGSWAVREMDFSAHEGRVLAASTAENFEALIAPNGRLFAILESPGTIGTTGRIGGRISVFPTRAAWSGPLASWEFHPETVAGNESTAGALALISFSPDDSLLLVKSVDPEISGRDSGPEELLLLRAADGQVRNVFQGLEICDVLWGNDSRQVAFCASSHGGQQGGERQLWLYDTLNGSLQRLSSAKSTHLAGWSHSPERLHLLQRNNKETVLTNLGLFDRVQVVLRQEEAVADLLISPTRNIGLWVRKNGQLEWLLF